MFTSWLLGSAKKAVNVLSRWTEGLTPSKQSVLIILGGINHIFSKSNYFVLKHGKDVFIFRSQIFLMGWRSLLWVNITFRKFLVRSCMIVYHLAQYLYHYLNSVLALYNVLQVNLKKTPKNLELSRPGKKWDLDLNA